MMDCWRLKHIPTGLYFKPSKHHNKSNLSKKGKVYTSKPTIKWTGKVYYHPDDLPRHSIGRCPTRPVIASEWIAEKVGEEGLGILKVRSDKGTVHKIKHISSPCGEYRLACGKVIGVPVSWDRETIKDPVTCKKCLAHPTINQETT